MSEFVYYRVTLLVPQARTDYLDGQSTPERWNWTELLDSPEPVVLETCERADA